MHPGVQKKAAIEVILVKGRQMSDKFITGSILALVGGFLDAYSYICRGKVFANAQTGNIVLFGVKLSEKDFNGAFHYLVPIIAFVMGIIIANIIRVKFKEQQLIHWRQIVVGLELVMLLVVANIPKGNLDEAANIIVSFVCSLQVESFRKVNGYAYASTMCTGNLRSGTENIFRYFKTKNADLLKASVYYYGIILFFIVGAAIGAIITGMFGAKAVYVAAIGLMAVTLMMFKKSEEE